MQDTDLSVVKPEIAILGRVYVGSMRPAFLYRAVNFLPTLGCAIAALGGALNVTVIGATVRLLRPDLCVA